MTEAEWKQLMDKRERKGLSAPSVRSNEELPVYLPRGGKVFPRDLIGITKEEFLELCNMKANYGHLVVLDDDASPSRNRESSSQDPTWKNWEALRTRIWGKRAPKKPTEAEEIEKVYAVHKLYFFLTQFQRKAPACPL